MNGIESVRYSSSAWTVESLRQRAIEGDLIVAPRFQRSFVWTEVQQVRFVESVLARLPFPPILLAEQEDARLVVVDGQQRLRTLFRFMDGELRLTHCELFRELEGMTWESLPTQFKRRFLVAEVPVHLIHRTADPEIPALIFERINTGGVPLTSQELRGAVLAGPAMDVVRWLARTERFRRILRGSHSDAWCEEAILAIFAVLTRGPDAVARPVQDNLNRTLAELNHGSLHGVLHPIERRFDLCLEYVDIVFGPFAFRAFDPNRQRWSKPASRAVMELQVWGFDRVHPPKGGWEGCADAVRERFRALHSDRAFFDAMRRRTIRAVRYRFELWERVLRHVASNHA